MPLAERDGAVRAAIDALGHEIDTVAALAVWTSALAAQPWAAPLVWVHGDRQPGYMLACDGRLAAVIDFGCLGVGDPACDLMAAWNFLSGDARDAFRSAVEADDAMWARGRGWALSVALIALPYYRDTNPTLAALSRHTIAAVLQDRAIGAG